MLIAAQDGHTEAVALLIEAKCDVDKAKVYECVCVCVCAREREGGGLRCSGIQHALLVQCSGHGVARA